MEHILRCHDFVKDDIVRADNCYLYDKNNKRYVDFEAGIWCTVLGHSNSKVNRVMTEQIGKVTHLGPRYTNYLAQEAAAELLDTVSLKDGKCLFLSSGSEAVELGIIITRLITGKKSMLTFAESYLGAYGFAGRKNDDWMTIDFNCCLTCEQAECFLDCENLKEINFDKVAAFVFEPGSSSGKVKFPPRKLIRLLDKKIRNSGGLIIIDEVTTGLGRTGEWYGFDHYQIKPDIIAFGKGLGNGYPVSAVTVTSEIGRELENRGFRYVQSHQNDPLGCAVASEVIKVILEDDLVNRSRRLGRKLIGNLTELEDRFSLIRQVRGRGLMASLEFAEAGDGVNVLWIAEEMLKRGFLIGFNPDANLIRFLPPLTIEENEIEAVVENLKAILE